MKIDRRSFLALGLGAAAGTTFTPMPWKVTDDISIWTQNWPWTPVPEDGAAAYEHTACTLCPGGCGITVRKINDRVVKIEGREGHPVNAGGICALGASGTQLLYGSSRVTSPMKRDGSRGSGRWKKISWDEAISEVVAKMKALETEKRQDSVACITSSDKGTVAQLFRRLLTSYGSPNFIRTPSMQDSFEVMLKKMHGRPDGVEAGFDIENAGFVLSFGSGIIEGWGSPLRMVRANSQWKDKKIKIVQIEQRLSNTAASSFKLLSVIPGTEADLALGIAGVIMDEGLYHEGFTGAYSTGFPEFRNMVRKYYTPDRVAQKTGIKRTTIIELARHFATPSTNALAICGKGKGSSAGSMREFMAVHSLNALIGKVNKKGGVWAVESPDYIRWAHDVFVRETIEGKSRVDEAGSERFKDSDYLLNRVPAVINSSKESPVQMLLVYGANPAYTMPGTEQVAEALSKIPYIVSFSTYMDETSELSDLILPNHSYLERYEDVPVYAGLVKPVINLVKPVVKPQYDTMHSGDVVIKIGKALGGKVTRAFSWSDYQECLKKTLGKKWAALDENGYWSDESYSPQPWDKAFGGTFRKFAFSGKKMSEPEFQGDEKKYPLILIPKESLRLSSGTVGGTPFVMKTVPDTVLKGDDAFIEINPETAEKTGLKEGSRVQLKTPAGSVIVGISFYDGIMPGVIAMPKGLGHTAWNIYLKGKGVNYNAVIAPAEDPETGHDVCRGIRAALVPV